MPFLTERMKNERVLEICAICGSSDLYRMKDFNRKLGLFILVLGIALSFFTYGVSLLLVTIIDWWLYKKVGELAVCYKCQALYRGYALDNIPAFNLVLFDHYRSRVRANG